MTLPCKHDCKWNAKLRENICSKCGYVSNEKIWQIPGYTLYEIVNGHMPENIMRRRSL